MGALLHGTRVPRGNGRGLFRPSEYKKCSDAVKGIIGTLVIRSKNRFEVHHFGVHECARIQDNPLNITLHSAAVRVDKSLSRNNGTNLLRQVASQRRHRIEKMVFALLVKLAILIQHHMKYDRVLGHRRQLFDLVGDFTFQASRGISRCEFLDFDLRARFKSLPMKTMA